VTIIKTIADFCFFITFLISLSPVVEARLWAFFTPTVCGYRKKLISLPAKERNSPGAV
jgi:hypothetical protein